MFDTALFPARVTFIYDGTCFSCPAPVAEGHRQCPECEAEQVIKDAARAARRAARLAAKRAEREARA